MSSDSFRDNARKILENMLSETPKADRQQLIDAYADLLTQLYAHESHRLLNDVIEDARTRLDARLSPDPVRQTIAGVQTTLQDLWNSLWKD
jgi:ABC-type transporter MlaC component